MTERNLNEIEDLITFQILNKRFQTGVPVMAVSVDYNPTPPKTKIYLDPKEQKMLDPHWPKQI